MFSDVWRRKTTASCFLHRRSDATADNWRQVWSSASTASWTPVQYARLSAPFKRYLSQALLCFSQLRLITLVAFYGNQNWCVKLWCPTRIFNGPAAIYIIWIPVYHTYLHSLLSLLVEQRIQCSICLTAYFKCMWCWLCVRLLRCRRSSPGVVVFIWRLAKGHVFIIAPNGQVLPRIRSTPLLSLVSRIAPSSSPVIRCWGRRTDSGHVEPTDITHIRLFHRRPNASTSPLPS